MIIGSSNTSEGAIASTQTTSAQATTIANLLRELWAPDRTDLGVGIGVGVSALIVVILAWRLSYRSFPTTQIGYEPVKALYSGLVQRTKQRSHLTN